MNKIESAEYARKRNARMKELGYKRISQYIHKDDVKKVQLYIKLLDAQRKFDES